MSWLARSLANSLIADVDQAHGDRPDDGGGGDLRSDEADELGADSDPNQGVKDDLSELTQTLTRQFWGVASFLAPPPSISSDLDRRSDPPAAGESDREEAADVSETAGFGGIRSDFAEIGGRFRSGISRLSNNASIGRIASSFIPFGAEEDEEEYEEEKVVEEEEDEEEIAVGVTEEVMVFARNVAMHPETWLDFPLFNEFEDTNDFEMSDAQREHAMAVVSLEPRLAALRIELCPTHMSEGCFWKIYFILLHSRLNKHDAELLSTPQIAEARAMLLQKLQIRTKPDYEPSPRGLPYRNVDISVLSPRGQVTSPSGMQSVNNPTNLYPLDGSNAMPGSYLETDKRAVQTTEDEIIDKSVIKEEPATQPKNNDLLGNFSEITIHDYDEDGDEWLEEESVGISGCTTIPYGNAEDVSFSDLEEEDEPRAPSSSKTVANALSTSGAPNKSNPCVHQSEW